MLISVSSGLRCDVSVALWIGCMKCDKSGNTIIGLFKRASTVAVVTVRLQRSRVRVLGSARAKARLCHARTVLRVYL